MQKLSHNGGNGMKKYESPRADVLLFALEDIMQMSDENSLFVDVFEQE